MQDEKQLAVRKLDERGIKIRDISEIVFNLQKGYNSLSITQCDKAVLDVINKREAAHAILTAISLDEMAERRMLEEPINTIILEDNPLFGIDEILALSIVNMHGSIALTNFGYVDKIKPGIIGKIDVIGKASNRCHTFLDDIIAAIVASAASHLAHTIEDNKRVA
jgi:phosphatidylglycerophosphatase A